MLARRSAPPRRSRAQPRSFQRSARTWAIWSGANAIAACCERRPPMMPSRWLHAPLIAGLFLAVGSSSAQSVEGVDLAKARARAKALQTKDLEAFSREIARRGEALKGA